MSEIIFEMFNKKKCLIEENFFSNLITTLSTTKECILIYVFVLLLCILMFPRYLFRRFFQIDCKILNQIILRFVYESRVCLTKRQEKIIRYRM